MHSRIFRLPFLCTSISADIVETETALRFLGKIHTKRGNNRLELNVCISRRCQRDIIFIADRVFYIHQLCIRWYTRTDHGTRNGSTNLKSVSLRNREHVPNETFFSSKGEICCSCVSRYQIDKSSRTQ